jgi:cytochrome c oxidase assembly protein subunit 15
MGALALTGWFLREERPNRVRTRNSKVAAWLAVAATIVVGATGALAALADTLFPSPTLGAGFAEDFAAHAPMLVRMRWLHPAAAVVGFCCVVWMVRAAGWKDGLGRTVLGLLGVQFALGIADVLLLAPVWMQVLHLLGADFYWVALVLLAAETVWPTAALSISRDAELSRVHFLA